MESVARGAGFFEDLEHLGHAAGGGVKGGQAVFDDVEAHGFEFLGRVQRRDAALNHVADAEALGAPSDLPQFLVVPRRLHEAGVGASLVVEVGPVDGVVQPVRPAGVRASYEEEVRIPDGVPRRRDLRRVLLRWDHRLAAHVAFCTQQRRRKKRKRQSGARLWPGLLMSKKEYTDIYRTSLARPDPVRERETDQKSVTS